MTKRTDSIVELQDRAKKLEALASLLQDPQLDEVVSKLFGETQMINTSDASVYRNVQWQPGGLMEAICAIAHEFRDPFTASEVVRRLKERQFVFRRPALDATRDALYRLTHGKNAKMRVVEMGRAGKPNRYALAS